MSRIVVESDNVHIGGYPGTFSRMCGVWSEEIDALAPEQSNSLKFKTGEELSCSLLCDILHTEGAEPIAFYGSNFYDGTPAITVNSFGRGKVYYFGTKPSCEALALFLDRIVGHVGITSVIEEKTELEVTLREKNGKKYYFVINFKDKELSLPKQFVGQRNLLNGELLSENTALKQYDVLIIIMF